MSSRNQVRSVVRLRRAVQVAALLLFFGLLLYAHVLASDAHAGWAKLFFWLDPLVLAATWLTTHAVPLVLLTSLAVVAITVVLGRAFCGWFCPFGTLHDLAGRFFDLVLPVARSGDRPQLNAKRRERWSPWQRAKYFLLAGFLVMAALGVHWVTVFDPIVLLYRSTTAAVVPAAQWAVQGVSTAVVQSNNPAVAALKPVTEPSYVYLRDSGVMLPARQAFWGGALIFGLFMLLLGLNAVSRRFWCRYLCPLGALLGLFVWRPWLRRTTATTCNHCGLCDRACHGAAAKGAGEQWIAAECLVCMSCTRDCPKQSLGFQATNLLQVEPAIASVDLSKRALLGSAVGGLVGTLLMRLDPVARRTRAEPDLPGDRFATVLRPPGARPEREFLQRCMSCGLCMKVCPTGALHPTWFEAGLEGLWTPQLLPRLGPCEINCVACTTVCPTEAIQPLTQDRKAEWRIGMASFDVGRCIPYAFGAECMICEECCPVADKAIYFVEVKTPRRGLAPGEEWPTVNQPRVDPAKCIGCGQCEANCVYRDQPAIRVLPTNETRHRGNQATLTLGSGDPY